MSTCKLPLKSTKKLYSCFILVRNHRKCILISPQVDQNPNRYTILDAPQRFIEYYGFHLQAGYWPGVRKINQNPIRTTKHETAKITIHLLFCCFCSRKIYSVYPWGPERAGWHLGFQTAFGHGEMVSASPFVTLECRPFRVLEFKPRTSRKPKKELRSAGTFRIMDFQVWIIL